MEILDWPISQEVSKKLKSSNLLVATILVFSLTYPLGYLLIDTLNIIALAPDLMKHGFQHISRYVVGSAFLVIPLLLTTLTDTPPHEEQL